MTVTHFDPNGTLVIISAHVWGPRGDTKVSLALDTGATLTHVVPDFLDGIGYGPQHGDRVMSVTSAIGEEPGYMMPLSRFSALGFTFENFRVHVHDIPNALGVHGLLGLSFLRQLNYEIRSDEGRILASMIKRLN